MKALRSFKHLSAPVPNGLRPSHLLEALEIPTLETKKAYKEALLQWILLSARGNLHAWRTRTPTRSCEPDDENSHISGDPFREGIRVMGRLESS